MTLTPSRTFKTHVDLSSSRNRHASLLPKVKSAEKNGALPLSFFSGPTLSRYGYGSDVLAASAQPARPNRGGRA